VDVQGLLSAFRRPILGVRLGQIFFFFLAFSFYMSCFALFASHRFTYDGKPFGATQVSYLYAFSGLIGIFVQGPLLPRLIARLGERKLATVGFAAMTVGYAVFSLTAFIPVVMVGIAIASFGGGVTRPAMTSLITKLTDRREQGAMLGMTQSLQALAQIIAPICGGFLIEHELLKSWALTASAIAFIGIAIGLRARQESDAPAPAAAH
jgi:MFS family permease